MGQHVRQHHSPQQHELRSRLVLLHSHAPSRQVQRPVGFHWDMCEAGLCAFSGAIHTGIHFRKQLVHVA